MTGAYAYAALTRASREGEKRLSALRKVTIEKPAPSKIITDQSKQKAKPKKK